MVAARPNDPRVRADADKSVSFGQRRQSSSSLMSFDPAVHRDRDVRAAEGGMEMSWVPTPSSKGRREERGSGSAKDRKPRVESFGAGMERGGGERDGRRGGTDAERQGRTERRRGGRSGSRNAFRQL